jgi:Subtilase family
MSAAPAELNLGIGPSKFTVDVKPLFRSIRTAPKTAIAKPAEWHILNAKVEDEEVNVWDLCHQMVSNGLGVAGVDSVEFAEPDIEQRWVCRTDLQQALAAVGLCEKAEDPDNRLPVGDGFYWFRDAAHSQLQQAREEVGKPTNRVRIAHFDTGYDPEHSTRPKFLRTDLQKNFADDEQSNDASDTSEGAFNNFGHGAGTLGILAGATATFDNSPLGGAAFLDVVPVRVANSVVLFRNSAVAKAFDYIHSLANNANTQVHVITMSMGGLASQAWADAVNALYELGVFIVTAAGNNFGNFPTRHIVYPARFKRVIAACGVMADGRPYADLPLNIMAGNYGPDSKMSTAFAAYTPNTPWAKFGCRELVDGNGAGTSSATPQIASAAALWIQKHKSQWDSYSQGWMRVEAVRKALGDSTKSENLREKLGRGIIQAQKALAQKPAKEADLVKTPKDSASFPFLRVITGLGVTASDPRQQMLELEALQIIQQSKELEELLPDPDQEVQSLSEADRQKVIDALASAPGASERLRKALGSQVRATRPQVSVPKQLTPAEQMILQRAIEPPPRDPLTRSLRVFAFDPLAATKLETVAINETIIPVRWEKLTPGPVGEYLEVVDIDPATGVCYAPINLDQPFPLSQAGYRPSEANPQFHQQMVYAVAMKTIEHFEKALGRVALWAPRILKFNGKYESHYIPRLRIYPHALREKNAYYSPDKTALLFGYFRTSESQAGENLPGQTIFCCLSHDIVAHETTHALLDGLHRRFREPTNADVLGFHEAFADIVALFQHFTVPEALRDQIAKTQGDLSKQSLLGELAQQFGQGVGRSRALRTAIGGYNDETGEWEPTEPTPADYANASEAHDRGAVLVAAVFEAFLNIYRRRSEDLIRLATSGTGILPKGNIPHDLVNRLAKEASKTASHVLNMCIRALDYSPPVDMNFGDYLRAFITADRDLVRDDDLRYRVAFLEAFRRRGIYPSGVRNLSTESVCWNTPELEINIEEGLNKMSLAWDLRTERKAVYDTSGTNAGTLNLWLKDTIKEDQARSLGFSLTQEATFTVENEVGKLSKFEVHSVRPVRRVGPDGQQQLDCVVEITQNWISESGTKYRGGSTLIIDLEKKKIRYVVRKTVANAARIEKQRGFRLSMADTTLRSNYFQDIVSGREPFAMLHRGA